MAEVYEAIDDELLDAVLTCRPAPAPGTAQVEVPGGIVVWGERSGVGTLAGISLAVWPYLDGTTSLGELAEDLAGALDADVYGAQQHLGAFGLDLLASHLATGLDPAAAIVAGRAAAGGSGSELIEYEQVIDGIHYRVSEHTLTVGQMREMTGGNASRAELVDPESCVGKRLHLDRPAKIRTVELAGDLFSVRVADDDIAEWVSGLPEARSGKGPVVALVTEAEAGGAQHRRFGVYDASGVLVASTTDRRAVRSTIAGLLASEADLAPPPGHEMRVRVLVRGDRAVVAALGALERPRGILRHLQRAGIEVLPANRAWLSDDGRTIALPESPVDPRNGEADRERRLQLCGIYAAGNKEAAVTDASIVHLLVRDTAPPPFEERLATLEAAARAVEQVPYVVAFRKSASALGVARQLIDLFGR